MPNSAGTKAVFDAMAAPSKLSYDVASALAQGQRDNQEDAVIADFPLGGDLGFAVLADGMGGHAAGDIASKIVVTEVFSELKRRSGDAEDFEANMPAILTEAVTAANACVRRHTDEHPSAQGMGATLVAPVLMDNRLYWISVGDSPLFLYRDGKLTQLNEDHSLAGQINLLVERGLMELETAENHPDRHCLTSVLIGDQIPRIDCPTDPVELREGDIVLVASDGLQFLDNEEIQGLLEEKAHLSSAEIAQCLIRALDALNDPHQDNTSICVIKVEPEAHHVAIDPRNIFAPSDDDDDGFALPDLPEDAILPPGALGAPGLNGEDAPKQIAAQASCDDGVNRITVVARKTIDGLSMLYHFKRPSERSA